MNFSKRTEALRFVNEAFISVIVFVVLIICMTFIGFRKR